MLYLEITQGSLEVKLPTIWTDESRGGKSKESQKRKLERRREEKRRSKKKKTEDVGARKGRQVSKHCVFPIICGSGVFKSRLAKAAEPSSQMRNSKLHAAVARSTFPSQKCPKKKLAGSDRFWTLRCRFAWQAQGCCTLPKVRQT